MKERDRYAQQVVNKVFGQMKGSAIFLTLFSKAYARDPHALMQLGMAVVLDKPLLLLVQVDTPLPENVRRMARAIETYRSLDDLELATMRLLTRAKELGLTGPLGLSYQDPP